MAKIIDGKKISTEIRTEISERVKELKIQGIVPGLAVVIVGTDPASQTYVKNKGKACDQVGFYSETHRLSEDTREEEVIALVKKLNSNPKINGILVQLPLPEQIDENAVIEAIDPKKDVDVFHPYNVGRMTIGSATLYPCTPAGVIELIERSGITIKGKECVVVGRSNIVGKPQALLLLQKHGTVTVCHSRTKDLSEVTKRADILVVAIGKANFITGDMVKEGAVVIDVGMNRNEQGKLCGDVDFEEVEKKAGFITPVPGGVGPMTITMLLRNTLKSCENSQG